MNHLCLYFGHEWEEKFIYYEESFGLLYPTYSIFSLPIVSTPNIYTGTYTECKKCHILIKKDENDLSEPIQKTENPNS